MADINRKDQIDKANPNNLEAMLEPIKLGQMLAGNIPVRNNRTSLSSNATQVNDIPGQILEVEQPAGTTLLKVGSGDTPGAGEVGVSYDANGLATLVFNGAVTAYSVDQLTLPTIVGGLAAKFAEVL